MDNPVKDKTPESSKKNGSNINVGQDNKWSVLWGPFYFILGIAGLCISGYALLHDFGNIVPLFGTVMAGVLTGALSILVILYGYRIIRRDF